jgi:hypothetical protein
MSTLSPSLFIMHHPPFIYFGSRTRSNIHHFQYQVVLEHVPAHVSCHNIHVPIHICQNLTCLTPTYTSQSSRNPRPHQRRRLGARRRRVLPPSTIRHYPLRLNPSWRLILSLSNVRHNLADEANQSSAFSHV